MEALFYAWLAAFGAAESLRVVYPTAPFTRGDTQVYLVAAPFPTEPQVVTVDTGESIYTWLLQVSILVRDDVRGLAATRLVDKLRAALPAYSTLAGASLAYTVMRPATAAGRVPTDGYHATPVTFRLQTIA